MLATAQAVADGGAAELVVHARTKDQGYRPPAEWERVAEIGAAVAIPLVANGDIWSATDAARCRAISGCDALMLGRGIVTDPGLALAVRGLPAPDWAALRPLLRVFWRHTARHVAPRHRPGRLKQWLNLLRRRFAEAEAAYQQLRAVTDPRAVEAWLA
jgi:tRNA-dihydrouridine synthase C